MRGPQIGDVLQFYSDFHREWKSAAAIDDEATLSRAMELCTSEPKDYRIISRPIEPVVVWPKEEP